MDKCSVGGCDNPTDRKGLCTRHYMRERRNGAPTAGRRAPGELTRFVMDQALPFKGDDCLIWPYYVNKRTGYAQAQLDGRLRLVHRYICETAHGAPPSRSHHAAHQCGVSTCVNPAHISWKTPLENAADKERHGTNASGEKHHNSKLTDDEVVAIRVLRGRLPTTEIMRIFGVSKTAISSIQLNKRRITTKATRNP